MAKFERSAGFVAYSQPTASSEVRYLLLDYGRHWDFPKGHVEAGEDDAAAAVRELAEETGLPPAKIDHAFRREVRYVFRGRDRQLIIKTVVFFLCQVASEAVTLSHEHVGYAFLQFSAAELRLKYATARALLAAANAAVTQAKPQ